MVNFQVFSFIGLFFATVYRIPQIVRIIHTKKADDLSSHSVHALNAAYLSFITYLVGTGKTHTEWVLCLYYVIGMIQNLIIFSLKQYYTSPVGIDNQQGQIQIPTNP